MPLVVAGDDRTDARRLQRLAEQGQLRRIHAGVYTDDLVQPLESIVRRELFALCSIVARGNIISHRSALENRRPTAAGNVFLTGPYRRDFDLPGVKLRIAKGPGPLASDIRIPTFGGDAFIDRKSTRLNSSHSQISYAVFCLKKKKNNLHNAHRLSRTVT